MAGDLRLLAGDGELLLPAGPAHCEALLMVCWQVMANDLAVTLGAAGGTLQLNTAQPLLARNVLDSLRLLADACASFEAHTLRGLTADRDRIAELLARAVPTADAQASSGPA